jgi:hypothetical protein
MRISLWNRLRRALGLPYTILLEAEDHIPADEVMMLRAHIDEVRDDPDYSVLISYECNWVEVGFGSDFGVLGNFSAFKT